MEALLISLDMRGSVVPPETGEGMRPRGFWARGLARYGGGANGCSGDAAVAVAPLSSHVRDSGNQARAG